MKILITGKTSRIGNAFMDYMQTKYPGEMIIDAVSLREDAWKTHSWSEYDAIIHAVGVTKADTTGMDADTERHYYDINRDLAIEAAKKAKADGVKHFIYLSTMMVYGNSAPIGRSFTIDKSTKPKPESVYGKSKLEGEMGVTDIANDSFILTVIREPVVYGEHLDGEFQKLLNLSKKVAVFPKINSTKSYIYEGNLCECFRQVILHRVQGIICPQNREVPTTSDLYSGMRVVQGKKTVKPGHMTGILKMLSHITRYVNAVFNDMKYTEELSRIEGVEYRVFSLEESILRCLK